MALAALQGLRTSVPFFIGDAVATYGLWVWFSSMIPGEQFGTPPPPNQSAFAKVRYSLWMLLRVSLASVSVPLYWYMASAPALSGASWMMKPVMASIVTLHIGQFIIHSNAIPDTSYPRIFADGIAALNKVINVVQNAEKKVFTLRGLYLTQIGISAAATAVLAYYAKKD